MGLLLIVLVGVGFFFSFFNNKVPTILKKKEKTMFLASNIESVPIYKKEVTDEENETVILVEKEKIARGFEVKAFDDKLSSNSSNFK